MATEISIKTADGEAKAWVHRPDGAGPFPGILYVADAIGIRQACHDMAARLAKLGYVVLVPNLFYRSGDFAPFNAKTVFGDPKERERLGTIMKALEPLKVMSDFGSYLDALKAQPGVNGKLGAVGYCMGGKFAFTAAAAHPEKLQAVASIHGGALTSDEPDSPHLGAPKIKARLYFGVAVDDRSCTPDQQARLVKALSDAKVAYQLELYPGASHGWAVDDMPVHDPASAELHWKRLEQLFGESLRS